jgi:hypothetical protein
MSYPKRWATSEVIMSRLNAASRATILNRLPSVLARWFLNLGWQYEAGINMEFAGQFRADTGLPGPGAHRSPNTSSA